MIQFRHALGVSFAITLSLISVVRAQPAGTPRSQGVWTLLPEMPPEVIAAPALARPKYSAALKINLNHLERSLRSVPMEDSPGAATPAIVSLPNPDGGFDRYAIVRTQMLAPELAAAVPSFRTFSGRRVDNARISVHMDITDLGIRAQFKGPDGFWAFIDPVSKGDTSHYVAYYAKDVNVLAGGTCLTHGEAEESTEEIVSPAASGAQLRTFRMVVATTGEFTQFYGGTPSSGMSAVTTAVNRLNQIFEPSFSIRFQLIANNLSFIYTNPNADPYDDTDIVGMLSENSNALAGIASSFDIGHVFGTNGGGVANLGVVCTANKARGVSSNFGPVFGGINAPAEALTFAHEVGHQFNMPHTWNGLGGNCSVSQWGTTNAAEPGAGCSIMSYGGICDPSQNYNDGTDRLPFFHAASAARINRFVEATATCHVPTDTNNVIPVITPLTNRVIPAGTPLQFVAVAVDPDSTDLTYQWEQLDVGPQVSLEVGDNGSSPLFRSFGPSASPVRTIPRLTDLIAGTVGVADSPPTTSRLIRMRCTVYDNRLGGGAQQDTTVKLQVYAGAGPFEVTFPRLTTDRMAGNSIVRWDNAGTNSPPVSTPNVRILLSLDGGANFDTVLAASVPNTGSALVTVPSVSTTTARIKIEAIDNYFFAITKTNFRIEPGNNAAAFDRGAPAITILDNAGNGNNNGQADPGESSILLFLPIRNLTSQFAIVVSGQLSSLTSTVAIQPGGDFVPYGNVNALATATNAGPFIISVSSLHPCGEPIHLRMSVGSLVFPDRSIIDFTIPTGTAQSLGAPLTFPSSGTEIAIPDADTNGISVPIVVTTGGLVGDIRVIIGGENCAGNSNALSNTVGLNHDRIGHLRMSLVSPIGTEVLLMHCPGGLTGIPPAGNNAVVIYGGLWSNSSNNLCNLTFADTASNPSIQDILLLPLGNGDTGPFTGTFNPLGELSTFRAEPMQGIWQLRVADVRPVGIGSIRNVSLQIRSLSIPVCQPSGTPPPLLCPADIADDQGNPLPGAPNVPNNGVTEADYNAFFFGFFDALAFCDIADDQGNPAPPGAPGVPNNGVTEGDYNCFFRFFFTACN